MAFYPGVSLITLDVADLDRARAFYESVGWRLSRGASTRDVAFFRLNNISLSLARRDRAVGAASARGVTLAQYHGGRGGVDRALADAVAAGGVLVPGQVGIGANSYGGAFADPEGHVWEVVCDPALPPDPEGGITP